jgi:hypothetical protein
MQRILGYLFFAALVVMAVVSLRDRFRGGSALNPFGREPDWLGIGLLAAALAGGVWLVATRERSRERPDGKGTIHGGNDGADGPGAGSPGAGP